MSNDFVDMYSNSSATELDNLIKKAEYNYIYTNEPLFTDEEYEILLELYNFKTGENRRSNVVKNKELLTQLPVYMPAIDKILHGNMTGLNSFTKKHTKLNYIITSKMDGGSALFDYNNGNMKLYTRGTYEEGQDISLLLKYITMPKFEDKDIIEFVNLGYVRGELIIAKSIFEAKYSKIYKTARALVAGMYKKFNISNSKFSEDNWKLSDLDIEIAKDIEFIVYEYINKSAGYELPPEEQLINLESCGFNTVKWKKHLGALTFDLLSDIYDKWIKKMDYNIDGLVIYYNDKYIRNTNSKPVHAYAYKKELDNLIGFSTVEKVEWNISKNGLLKPLIYIKPIIINNTEIRKTTGINAKFIIDNKIGPGAEVKIIRSGDVIPNIFNVLKPAEEITLPDTNIYNYKWNTNKTDFIINEDNDEMQMKKILFFLETLNIKGISVATVEKLYNNGIKSCGQYFNLTLNDLKPLGDITAAKLLKEINKSIKKLTVPQLMTAVGIFPTGLGIKKIQSIYENIPDLLSSNYINDLNLLSIKINNIKGFSTITTDKFISKYLEFIDFYNEHKKLFPVLTPPPMAPNGANNLFQNKNIVITGFRNNIIEDFIIKNGGKITSGVNSKTHLVIKKDNDYHNTKIYTASILNIDTISLIDFKLKYNI
jgi:NAD-dependent DNA ligase